MFPVLKTYDFDSVNNKVFQQRQIWNANFKTFCTRKLIKHLCCARPSEARSVSLRAVKCCKIVLFVYELLWSLLQLSFLRLACDSNLWQHFVGANRTPNLTARLQCCQICSWKEINFQKWHSNLQTSSPTGSSRDRFESNVLMTSTNNNFSLRPVAVANHRVVIAIAWAV